MPQWIDRPGIFRGTPIEVGIQDSDNSSSLGLRVVMTVQEYLNQQTNEWEDWNQFDFRASGTFWIIKKDGSLNDNPDPDKFSTVRMVRDILGWDGNLENPDVGVLNPCQFTVNEEDYKGKAQFKLGFLNHWDFKPGPKTVDPATVKKLSVQHGSKLRAFFGQKQTKAPAPAGRPAAPPAPPKSAPPSQIEEGDLPPW